jgi:hypothetical protein
VLKIKPKELVSVSLLPDDRILVDVSGFVDVEGTVSVMTVTVHGVILTDDLNELGLGLTPDDRILSGCVSVEGTASVMTVTDNGVNLAMI